MSHDPPKWEIFEKYGAYIDGHHFGLFTTIGNINRFKARYRAAKAFLHVKLDGFSPDTEGGYSALTREFYAYAAFEPFLRSIGVKQKKTGPLLSRYPTDDWAYMLKAADTGDAFFSFLIDYVDAAHRHHIRNYLVGKPFIYLYLTSAVRHTFAHGMLTPGAGDCAPGQAQTVADILTNSLFEVMDTEFSERMEHLKKAASAS